MFLFDSASRSYSKKKIILTVNLPKNQGQHILNPEFSLFFCNFVSVLVSFKILTFLLNCNALSKPYS